MGNLCSGAGGETEPSIPGVIKDDEDKLEDLPFGVVLTGGAKLRKDGLNGTGVKVGVIDSGVDESHPGFDGKVTRKQWYRSGTPLSEDDHGTHVAGTIHLMAPQAEIYDYRVFGGSGSISVANAIAKAIRAAVDDGCQLINMSLGGPSPISAIKRAVDYAHSKDVLLVCAAGNEGDKNPMTNEIGYPAFYEECISIAAVSKKNNFPVAVFSNSNSQVDYAAIGVDVVSFKPGGGFQRMSGTSMAAPHACGLMACLVQKHGGTKELRKIMNDNYAIDIASEGIDNETGFGLLSFLDGAEFDTLLPRSKAVAVA
mmetsp:Transcript_3921/g.5155  ORF Transcript_3921/g.5155 Transcript_3921/m.5155 type:complete len:312 (-) Transcript_3921:222-1157(-)|eukprot:CAMPEP_0198146638 /NCGR_PEP_ID=MMETSP1443-20131203/30505_1 /TAXON_ID=186043 /ORGANISM="Entomoneis sp., Strain CCMP2396" /LENGTH=311 /DNA_ID=CAMNT_0043810671 /DNA_START=51 /DNA_END=986 /DNA_ORIENTATION=-